MSIPPTTDVSSVETLLRLRDNARNAILETLSDGQFTLIKSVDKTKLTFHNPTTQRHLQNIIRLTLR